MSLPLFDELQTRFPQSVVDIIAKESIRDVFLYHPVIRTIHSFSKIRVAGVFELLRYGRALRKYTLYDLFLTLPPSFSSALMGYGVGSHFRLGYKAEGRSLLLTHSFPQPSGIHRVQAYCLLLQNFHAARAPHHSVTSRDAFPQKIRFYFSKKEQQTRVLSKQQDIAYIVFNVNSEAPSRRLPLEKWQALGRKLLQDKTQKRRIVFIGTAGERDRVATVMKAIKPQDALLDFSGKTSLRELAMLLRDADLVISNDSGPMHLANAVGTPLVTFFGAGNPMETGPFNQTNAIIIDKHLECSPCVKNICKFPTVKCLEQITVDEIYRSVIRLMSKG